MKWGVRFSPTANVGPIDDLVANLSQTVVRAKFTFAVNLQVNSSFGFSRSECLLKRSMHCASASDVCLAVAVHFDCLRVSSFTIKWPQSKTLRIKYRKFKNFLIPIKIGCYSIIPV